jgi:hypothetical protein
MAAGGRYRTMFDLQAARFADGDNGVGGHDGACVHDGAGVNDDDPGAGGTRTTAGDDR